MDGRLQDLGRGGSRDPGRARARLRGLGYGGEGWWVMGASGARGGDGCNIP